MPKTTLKYETKEAIPADLQPYAKDDNSVEIWFGTNEQAVAGELNPGLESNRNKILGEKTVIEEKYNALLQTASSSDIDTAKIVAENERLKKTTVPAEDLEIVKTVKTLFPNIQPAELKTNIESLKTKAETGDNLLTAGKRKTAAEVLGYKNTEYFNDVLQIPGMLERVKGDIFVETVTENEKPVQKAYVNVEQADGTVQKQLFSEYKKSNVKWSLHEPTLMLQTQTPDNKKWVNQTGGDGDDKATGGMLSGFIKKTNEKAAAVPNPLVRNQPGSQGAGGQQPPQQQPTSFTGVNQN